MSDEARLTRDCRRRSEFYARCVGDAAKLIEVAAISGLDKELAMVRVKLEEHAREHPEDLRLVLAGAKLVAQIVAQQYRMSPGAHRRARRQPGGDGPLADMQQLFPEKVR